MSFEIAKIILFIYKIIKVLKIKEIIHKKNSTFAVFF